MTAKSLAWIFNQAGLQRHVVMLIFGSVSALGFVYSNYWFILSLFAFIALLKALESCATSQHAFWSGYFFGLGHFAMGLYWIGEAFRTVDLAFLMPLGWIGLPLLFGFYLAIASYATFRFTQEPHARALIFAALWGLVEWGRGHFFTGFPWNLPGYIWPLEILQITSFIGIYGLTALTVLFFVAPYSRSKVLTSAIILLFVAMYCWGNYRLTHAPQEETDINLRLIQASIPQNQKWLQEKFEENLLKHIALSQLEAERPLHAILWAESSVPTFVESNLTLLKLIAQAAPPQGFVIIGAPRALRQNQGEHWYTGLLALNERAEVVGAYEKSHLVPFGEFMPFKSILNLKKLTYGSQDYTPGPGIRTLTVPGLPPFSPLICYEVIFPGKVMDRLERPQWLLNQTNDAWYGDSAGPRQHLKIASVRAIEEGVPLVRIANNGISAVTNAYGQILYRLELNEVGFIDFRLPKMLEKPTLYSQLPGELFFWVVVTIYLLTSLLVERRIIKKNAIKFV